MSSENALTILVVEDSLTASKMIESYLYSHGFRVHVASDGMLAMAALRFHHPDMVFLDVRLPHVDGIQLCGLMRRKYPEMPIVMLSGLSSEGVIENAYKAGANNYLIKPVTEQQVISAATEQLSGVGKLVPAV